MFKKTVCIVCLLVLSACSSSPSKKVASSAQEIKKTFFLTDFSQVNVPGQVGQFIEGSSTSFGDKQLGFVVNYFSKDLPGVKFDVYVYPIVLPELFSLSDMADMHMNNLLKDIVSISPGTELEDYSIFTGQENNKNYAALKARLLFIRPTRQDSYVYLALVDDVYIKIRFTASETQFNSDAVDKLAAMLLTQISFTDPAAHKHELGLTVTRTTMELARSDTELAGLMTYGLALRKEVENGAYLDTPERAYKLWGTVAGAWPGIKAKSKTPDAATPMDALAAIYKAGYLTEYLWEHYRRPYWTDSAELKHKEFSEWAIQYLVGHDPYPHPGLLVVWDKEEKTDKNPKDKKQE